MSNFFKELRHKYHFTIWIREHFATRHTEKIDPVKWDGVFPCATYALP